MSKKPNATPQEDQSGGGGIGLTATTSFDYSLLPDDVANDAKEVAVKFRAFQVRTVEGMAEIPPTGTLPNQPRGPIARDQSSCAEGSFSAVNS